MGGATLGIFTPFAALEPDQPQSERTMVSLVSKLNRDDALLMCGFLNCVTSGSGPTEDLERQRNAYSALFTPDDAAKIDAFIAEHRAANRITLFFRGQLLELMRWVARYANADPGDGQTFSSLETRRLFVRAAFLAADLWAKRTFADKLTGAGTQEQALNRALGALRKGVEEAGTALHIGVALARGKALFEDHMPARLPSFPADFQAATGLTVEEYIVREVMDKSAFSIYDGDVLSEMVGLRDSLGATLAYDHLYRETANMKVQVFGRGDFDQTDQEREAWRAINAARNDLAKHLQALLALIRERYLEVDIDVTNAEFAAAMKRNDL